MRARRPPLAARRLAVGRTGFDEIQRGIPAARGPAPPTHRARDAQPETSMPLAARSALHPGAPGCLRARPARLAAHAAARPGRSFRAASGAGWFLQINIADSKNKKPLTARLR